MDTTLIQDLWQWLQGDLASWLAVVLAVIAIIFALRKAQHTELNLNKLHFNSEGGPITLELDLTTYSHASRLEAKAKLKIDELDYPLIREPINTPTNYRFATVNTFQLRFTGQYEKRSEIPKTAFIDVKTKLSDGSRARLRKTIDLEFDESSSQSKSDKEGSQS